MDGYIENENAYPDDEYIYNETFIGEDGEEYYYEEPLISLFDVVKEYDKGTVKALNGINLDIFEGEFVSIIGPSGSGKSTLLNMLGALDKPTRGKIYIDGIDLVKEKDLSEFRQEKIGFVFQLHNLIPNLSVFDNVQIPLLPTGMSNKEMKEKASEIIRAVGLEDKKKQRPNKLSGGQKQRVAIAGVVAMRPKCIVLDEPTAMLDPNGRKEVLRTVEDLRKREKVTVILITHYMEEVEQLCNRIIIIDHGTWNMIDGSFDTSIFTESKMSMEYKLAFKAEKHIKDFVFVDGINKTDSIERNFAAELDNASEVCVYAKLPRGFYIPTPVGNYSPDWAIAFKEGSVQHVYFVAETKGTLESLQLKPVEQAKIDCASKLFNGLLNTEDIRYGLIKDYDSLIKLVNAE